MKRNSMDTLKREQGAFTLLEVIIAASILGIGLLSIVQVFPYGIQASRRAEDLTQASMLAQSMFEGLKADPVNFPIIPGADNMLVPLPGNGYDDDTNNEMFNPAMGNRNNPYDLNKNGKPDIDFDGMPEADGLVGLNVRANGVDDDGDKIPDDNGDSYSRTDSRIQRMFRHLRTGAPDGNLYYDPEPNIDEELPNGVDDDGDGLIDEDVRMASVRIARSQAMLPLLAGDRMDNDGDGEDNDDNPETPAIADGIDNNGDGRIDEGIDEERWDGIDNDGDGLIDEDCQLAAFPVAPCPFPEPNSDFSWQVRVGFVPDNGRYGITDLNGDGIPDLGDGIDNDGDGRVDEEIKDGLDMDFPTAVGRRRGIAYFRSYGNYNAAEKDGQVDEDCIASPLPHWRRIEIVITWGGNREDDDGDLQKVDPRSEGYLGISADDELSRRNQRISYGAVNWGVDEEKRDGIDNDFDGEIDEDTYEYEFTLVGFIHLKDPSQSFSLKGGQPRGMAFTPREQ